MQRMSAVRRNATGLAKSFAASLLLQSSLEIQFFSSIIAVFRCFVSEHKRDGTHSRRRP
jgi:hypothetical protein